MSEILVLQHVAGEPLGTIAEALDRAGAGYRYHESFSGRPTPADLGDAAGLIVLGGPMGVYEQEAYPFLGAEMHLIEQALERERPVLGVCLGSQLLASVLGAPVEPGPEREIGWYPVTLTDAATDDPVWRGAPREFMGFHWHGDQFALPQGAVTLAASEITPCQAFRYGRNAYGVLFHMEVTEPMIRDWISNSLDYLAGAGVAPETVLEGIPPHWTALHRLGQDVFGQWAGLVTAGE